ncbi:MAG: hypothetical protein ACRDY2_10065 [Acidimicrobiales bacterium]
MPGTGRRLHRGGRSGWDHDPGANLGPGAEGQGYYGYVPWAQDYDWHA